LVVQLEIMKLFVVCGQTTECFVGKLVYGCIVCDFSVLLNLFVNST